MSWSKSLQRTTKPEPYDHVTWCPLCGIEIAVVRDGLAPVMPLIERDVKAHLATYHRFRYWAWSRLGGRTTRPWKWLITGVGS